MQQHSIISWLVRPAAPDDKGNYRSWQVVNAPTAIDAAKVTAAFRKNVGARPVQAYDAVPQRLEPGHVASVRGAGTTNADARLRNSTFENLQVAMASMFDWDKSVTVNL